MACTTPAPIGPSGIGLAGPSEDATGILGDAVNPKQAEQILVVEDNPCHIELLQAALTLQGLGEAARIVHRADAALAVLDAQASALRPSLPRLILLDLNLNGEQGLALLRRLRHDDRFAAIPVVMLTTSDNRRDVAACYAASANGYVVKPDTFEGLVAMIGDLARYWLTWNRSVSSAERPC